VFTPEAACLLGVSSIDVMERAGSFSPKDGRALHPNNAASVAIFTRTAPPSREQDSN
jgi:hypothetical protein